MWGSVVKSSHCSFKGSEFNSQHPGQVPPKPLITAPPVDLTPLTSTGTGTLHIPTQKHVHIYTITNKSLEEKKGHMGDDSDR